ncbi:hypothetical protein YC2023_035790 [Brassica napus]
MRHRHSINLPEAQIWFICCDELFWLKIFLHEVLSSNQKLMFGGPSWRQGDNRRGGDRRRYRRISGGNRRRKKRGVAQRKKKEMGKKKWLVGIKPRVRRILSVGIPSEF